MTDLFDKVTEGQDAFKKLASKIPGFEGYIERQNRRAADKLLRENVADAFEALWKRATQLQVSLVDAGMISYVDEMEKAAIQLRTFVDKIRRASYGYSGFFDAVKINEAELANLYQFDAGFFDLAEKISHALDNVDASLNDESGLPAAIRSLISLAQEAVSTFEKRSQVITGA